MKASTYVSPYLKADVLRESGPQVLEVVGVEEVELPIRDTDRVERKLGVIVDGGLRLLLNKQNTLTLIEVFKSDDTDNWLGRSFEAYFDPNVGFGGKKTGGIRVREANVF